MAGMPRDPKSPPGGRFQRLRKLATISAQVGADVLGQSVRRWRGREPSESEAGLSASTAEKLVATLGDLKGAAMKLGQAVSMDSDLVSPEVRAILSRLQNEAPPMPYETVAGVVRSELGESPEALFATFDREPLAAASLGQVHRATLEDGRAVVVKVQYPGVDESLKTDLASLRLVVKTLARTSKALDGRDYYAELERELAAELDYQREAELASGFGEVVRAHAIEGLCTPEVIASRSARRVLTLEYLPGVTLRAFSGRSPRPGPEERFRVSRLLIRAVYGPFLAAGWIHSDPHPGNFIVMPDGRLGLVDFGSVKRFSEGFVAANRRTLLRALRHDLDDVLQILRDVGFTLSLPEVEARAVTEEILEIAGRPLRTDAYDFAQCTMASDMKKLGSKRMGAMLKIRPPQEAVMFFRGTGGCTQNLKMLGACGDFRGIYQELTSLF